MLEELQKIIDSFVREMEGVNDKRLEASLADTGNVMKEVKLFNKLRQRLSVIDKIDLNKKIKELNKEKESLIDEMNDLNELEKEIFNGIPKNK